jgi:hypothetical protein
MQEDIVSFLKKFGLTKLEMQKDINSFPIFLTWQNQNFKTTLIHFQTILA